MWKSTSDFFCPALSISLYNEKTQNMSNSIVFQPIGIIRTPFTTTQNMPVQPAGAKGIEGIIELNSEFTNGLADIEGFSHIILLYHFHLLQKYQLTVVPFMDDKPHGIFSTRAPARPNAIGISTVKLTKVKGNLLYIEGVDMINETPLLDIKPFFPQYDNQHEVRSGWLGAKGNIDISKIRSDNRF
jgi:tRNA-Thr(GGU) m(6)t(6)A37 methyltransferase TsaA